MQLLLLKMHSNGECHPEWEVHKYETSLKSVQRFWDTGSLLLCESGCGRRGYYLRLQHDTHWICVWVSELEAVMLARGSPNEAMLVYQARRSQQ